MSDSADGTPEKCLWAAVLLRTVGDLKSSKGQDFDSALAFINSSWVHEVCDLVGCNGTRFVKECRKIIDNRGRNEETEACLG